MIEQHTGNIRYVQFALLQQFPELIHGAFMRHGGSSKHQYSSLNTMGSLRGGDDLDHVISNRQAVMHALGIDDYPCLTLWGIHSANVMVPDASEHWRTDWTQRSYYEQAWRPEQIHQADALVTKRRGVAMAQSFADCVPIVLYDPVQRVVANTHAGWRGTARGIAIATVETMQQRFASQPRDIYAGIGPSIGSCCYTVSEQTYRIFLGDEHFEELPTRTEYQSRVREATTFIIDEQDNGTLYRPDLWEINRRQLQLAGLAPDHIEVAGICTGCHTQDFFSHRKEHANTGRFPVVVALRA